MRKNPWGWALSLVLVACALPSVKASDQAQISGKSSPLTSAPSKFVPAGPVPPLAQELSRLWVHNVVQGLIQGSHDGGKTWQVLGHVTHPMTGGIWEPTKDGVLAFNFQRGSSEMFATAVNALHIRMSDPVGYTLPLDPTAPLVTPHGVSLMPFDAIDDNGTGGTPRDAVTDIPAGTSIFGADWSPRVGSKAYMGDGVRYSPIPYDTAPTDADPNRANILIVTSSAAESTQYYQFENKVGGRVLVKQKAQAQPVQVAKVIKPLEGIGRFEGSEHVLRPGSVRAGHAGVICIGTTDVRTDVSVSAAIGNEALVNDLRGGFQIIPSHHFHDPSMQSGGDHAQVYLEIGPIIDPPNLIRYDMGIEGTAPLYHEGVRAGTTTVRFRFKGQAASDPTWYTVEEGIKAQKFVRKDGTVLQHLRGMMLDALIQVTDIRIDF